MKNIEFILSKNASYVYGHRPLMKTKLCFEFKNKESVVNGLVIKKIICFANTIKKFYPKIPCQVHFNLGRIKFQDKISCTILEAICYTLIAEFGYIVRVSYEILPSIESEGGRTSPLLILKTGEKQSCETYLHKFLNSIYKNHFRKVVPAETTGPTLSIEMGNVETFLHFGGVEQQYARELAKVIAELIGNANEHTGSDCLVDIDIATDYYNKENHKKAIGVNVAVLNFSDIKLGDPVREKLLGSVNPVDFPEQYMKVQNAYHMHESFFDSDYIQEDFFNVASFQHKISGNRKKTYTGGTGLTQLLHSLENYAEAHKCYFISGKRGLWFFQDEISTDGYNGVGFNKEHNFFEYRPSENAIAKCAITIPGTAYNLTFIFPQDMGDNDGDE